jgi:hypothetical protein
MNKKTRGHSVDIKLDTEATGSDISTLVVFVKVQKHRDMASYHKRDSMQVK